MIRFISYVNQADANWDHPFVKKKMLYTLQKLYKAVYLHVQILLHAVAQLERA